MKRGEIWIVVGGPGYTGKPRPAVIVQDDAFDATASVTVCPFTTDPTEAPLFRIAVEPNGQNSLRADCRLMVDKLTAVPRERLGARIGSLDDRDLVRLNQSILVFLGLAASVRTSKRS